MILAGVAVATAGCADETAVVATIEGLPILRDGVSLCLTARRGHGVEFVGGYGTGRAGSLPDGDVSLTFVAEDPSTGGELVLVAEARVAGRVLGPSSTRIGFREGHVERTSIALDACTATAAGALGTLATREADELPANVLVLDADADGRDDIVGMDDAGAFVRIDALSGAPIGGPVREMPTSAAGAVALDLDGDCAPEIAIAGTELEVAPLVAHDPSAVVRRIAIAATTLAAGDVNGDGRDDVVATSGDATFVVSADGGDGLSRTASLPTGPALHLVAGDLDGDARAEVLVVGADGTRLWRGGTMPTERSEALPVALASIDSRLELGDIDDDGALDAVGIHSDGSIVLARNRGDGLLEDWTTAALRDVPLDAIVRDVAIADVTGDCVVDLVLAVDAGVPRVLRGRPGGGFEPGPALEAVQCREVVALDVDGDGHAEIGAITASGRLAILGARR